MIHKVFQNYDLRKTFAIDKKLLFFAGFYPRRSSKNNYLYLFGAFINSFFSAAQIISMTVRMIIDRNDLSKLVDSLQHFITLSTYVCKLINFLYYRKKLIHIEDNLTKPIFYGFSYDQLDLMEEKINSCKKVGKIFRFLCVNAVTCYILTPFLDNDGSKNLPYPGWFPYNVTKYYYTTVTFQVLGVANTAYTNSSIDILTWMLISIASGQFEILKHNLKNINWQDDQKKTEKQFVSCVKHHEEIVK